jgi:8-oxo-dGTP diphosphatase
MPPRGPLREAVVAVITRGHEVLLIRRAAGVPDPGYWAPPSGNIELGESQEAAVIREVREEVGLMVRPVVKLWESVSSSGTHTLYWWRAEYVDGTLALNRREVADARWVDRAEIDAVEPLFPVDRAFFRAWREGTIRE